MSTSLKKAAAVCAFAVAMVVAHPALAAAAPKKPKPVNLVIAIGGYLELTDSSMSTDGGATYLTPPIGEAGARAAFEEACRAREGDKYSVDVLVKNRSIAYKSALTQSATVVDIKRSPVRAEDVMGFAAGFGKYEATCFVKVVLGGIPSSGTRYVVDPFQQLARGEIIYSRAELARQKWNPLLILPRSTAVGTAPPYSWVGGDLPQKGEWAD